MKIEPLPEQMHALAVTLWHDAGLTRPWNDPDDDLRKAMMGGTSTVLACTDGDHLLATAMVGYDGHRGWVYYLAVVESAQRRGLGRGMMRTCEGWLRQRGAAKIQVMVRHTNKSVVSFYDTLGYADSDVAVLGRRLDVIGRGEHVG